MFFNVIRTSKVSNNNWNQGFEVLVQNNKIENNPQQTGASDKPELTKSSDISGEKL